MSKSLSFIIKAKALLLLTICMSIVSNVSAFDPSCTLKKISHNLKHSASAQKLALDSESTPHSNDEVPLQDCQNLSNSSEEEVHSCADFLLSDIALVSQHCVLLERIVVHDEIESQKVLFFIHRPPSLHSSSFLA